MRYIRTYFYIVLFLFLVYLFFYVRFYCLGSFSNILVFLLCFNSILFLLLWSSSNLFLQFFFQLFPFSVYCFSFVILLFIEGTTILIFTGKNIISSILLLHILRILSFFIYIFLFLVSILFFFQFLFWFLLFSFLFL